MAQKTLSLTLIGNEHYLARYPCLLCDDCSLNGLIAHQKRHSRFLNSTTPSAISSAEQDLKSSALHLAVVTYGIYTWTYDTLTPIQWTDRSGLGMGSLRRIGRPRLLRFHRASHRVQIFWACHIVHHQSEEYNLSVALRQSWFGGFIGWVFYTPLALVGFTPAMIAGGQAH